MKIVVFGLGYLGSTVAACTVADGHEVIGIDPDPQRWIPLQDGASPVFEPGLSELLRAGWADGRLLARADVGDSIENADMVIVCVGTPLSSSDSLDMSQIVSATTQIAVALRSRSREQPLCLVYRSTLTPGTMDGLILPLLATTSGYDPGTAYEACYNPESLREGSAIDDYRRPPRIILGERYPGATRRLLNLYGETNTPVYEVSYAAAELSKLADNSFHAMKIAFANELGRCATSLDIDAQLFADVFVADDRLNISAAYLRPGGAFGGPCLRKDTQALVQTMATRGVSTPLLSSIISSNETHHSFLYREISKSLMDQPKVLIFGIGFKAGSIDLRDSPAIALALEMIDAGYSLSVCDPDADLIVDFQQRLPSKLQQRWVSDIAQAADQTDIIILCKPATNFPFKKRTFDVTQMRSVNFE